MTGIERLGVVVALTVLVLAITFLARRKPMIRERPVDSHGLMPGLYLLTSEGCESCGRARERLQSFGIAFEEASWQSRPEIFSDLGIDAVPSVIAVDETGRGRWWRGGVPRPGRVKGLEMPRTGANGG